MGLFYTLGRRIKIFNAVMCLQKYCVDLLQDSSGSFVSGEELSTIENLVGIWVQNTPKPSSYGLLRDLERGTIREKNRV